MWSDIIICNTLNRYFCDMVMRKFQKPGFSGCPMPYLGPYHLPLFKGSPQMLSTGSNRILKGGKVTRTSLHLPSYLMLSYMQNKNSFSCHHDVIRFCKYFSNQSGWLGEVSLHEQCRVDFTKMHPQRAPKSMFSCRSILFHL